MQQIVKLTIWTGGEKQFSGSNPKSMKISKLMNILKIDIWNKITYKKWNICNLLSLPANQIEKEGKS